MKHLKLFFVACASLFLASCLSDDEPENTWKYTYSDNFSLITDQQSEAVYTTPGATYILSCDLNSGTCDFVINDLQLQPGLAKMDLELENLKFSYNKQGGLVVNAPAVTTTSNHEITNFSLVHYRKYIPQVGSTAIASTYYITYIVNGKYLVKVVQENVVQTGTTAVTDLTNSSTTTQDLPYYSYNLSRETMTATFRAHNISYGSVNPVTITIGKIPFTIGAAGINIQAQGPVNATVNSSPDPNTQVTNISIRPDFTCSMTAVFTIDSRYLISATLGPTVGANILAD